MLLRLITPGDVLKDSMCAGAGFATPALLLAHLDATVVIGLLNLLVIAIFRAVELRLKYGRKGTQNDADTPRQN